jgi:excisionase family DNA binding protein
MTEIHELASAALRRVQRADFILPRLLDIDDAARYLGTSDKSVRALIAAGELGYIQKIPGRSPYLLDRLELDDWVNHNKRFAAGVESPDATPKTSPELRAEREGR